VGADIFDPVELTRGNGAPAGHTTPHNTVRGRDMIGHMPKARRPRGAHHKIIKHHRQPGARHNSYVPPRWPPGAAGDAQHRAWSAITASEPCGELSRLDYS